MPEPRSAAIYARISLDGTGEGLGVQRQLEDCRTLAARQGWTVGDEYVDNGISAYKDLKRPEFDRMLSDIELGLRDAVIVWKPDRISRRPAVIERFLEVCGRAGVGTVATADQVFSLGDAGGLFSIRLWGLLAAQESGLKSERLRRKAREVAESGRPNGGHFRPFGYESDRVTVVEAEAEVIRQVASRYLAGESLKSLTTWLQDEGMRTVADGPWRTSTLRTLLTSPRIAGLRAHNGVVVADAVWPAIITRELHEQLVAEFGRKKVTGRRTGRRYVLSGMLRCGKCGNRLFSSPRGERRRYVCSSSPDHGGCGRLTVVAEPVEAWVTEAVLTRLDTPALADALTGRAAADERHAAVRIALESDQEQMRELAEMWAAKSITAGEWRAAREPIETRVRQAERQLFALTGDHALNGLAGQGEELRRSWERLNLTRQIAIVKAVLDFATILPGTPGARGLDPARVVPTWRL